jgi:choline kinase
MATGDASLKVVVLAAGVGSRLGLARPKALVDLADGRSILQQQLENVEPWVDPDDVLVVVGYKKELVMERFPRNAFVYNENFSGTNTSKSLLRALLRCRGSDVLWMNGDVVFEPDLLGAVLAGQRSAVAVAAGKVGEEEVKYRTDDDGTICEISKTVEDAEGEAVGVNVVLAADLDLLIRCLEMCDDHDYFERALELAIERGMPIRAADVSAHGCIEIDFPEDLVRANEMLASMRPVGAAAGEGLRASVA